MVVPFGQADSLVHPEVRSSVEIDNSCNDCCTGCFQRRIKKVRQPVVRNNTQSMPNLPKEDSSVEVTATGIKVHTASTPVLTKSGHWEVSIDGKKDGE